MTPAFDFSKLRRLIKIYGVVQILLVVLLIYMAMNFQAVLQQRFLSSVIVTLLMQLALFYPISKFASSQAEREINACNPALTPEELKSLRTKRIVGDVVKISVMIFFITFILRMPPNKFLLSVVFFTFILTTLSYFQCFNFAARRKMTTLQ